MCKQLKSTRPDSTHRRGLYFPGKDKKPQLVWVRTEVKAATAARGHHDEIFDATPFDVETRARHVSIRSNIQARCLTRTLIPGGHEEVAYHLGRDSAQLPPNTAAQRFTRAGAGGSWLRGPILVLRHLGMAEMKHYQDIEMRDVCHAADFFSVFFRGHGLQDSSYLAAIALCETSAEGTSVYDSRTLDEKDDLWSMQGSPISNLIGIPILIGPVHDVSLRQRYQMGHNHIDRLAVDLNATKVGNKMAYDEEEQGPAGEVFKGQYGFGSPAILDDPTGPRCAVRADGVPLLPGQLEALIEYAKQKVEPLVAESIAGLPKPSDVVRRTQVLDCINKTRFLSFFDEYKIRKGGNWSAVPSPWEMNSPILLRPGQAPRVIR